MLGMNVPDRVNPPDYFIDVLEGIVKPDSEIDIKHLPLHWILYNGYDVPKDMQRDLEDINGSNRNGRLSSVRSESLESGRSDVLDNVRYSCSEGMGDDQRQSKKSTDLSNRKTPGILKQYRYYLGR
jgi:ABC-2 type transporter